MSWIPATTPICMVSCAAALAIPRFDSSTALAMLAVMDGDAMPEPTPDRASAATMTRADELGWIDANTSIDSDRAAVPTTAADRSPHLTARYPAMGAVMEKVSGRAITIR